jgi:bifunctional aspartokinase / homoserine dehydrogenase 1
MATNKIISALGLSTLAFFSVSSGFAGVDAFAPVGLVRSGHRPPILDVTKSQHWATTIVTDETSATTKTEVDCSITNPKGCVNQWEVHKFGGASLATAELYRTVGDLLIREAAGRGQGPVPTMAVVSARAGMTDLLVKVVDSALLDFEQAMDDLEEAVESQIFLLKELAPPEITDAIEAGFRKDAQDILSVVQSLKMIQTIPPVTMEVVSGFGEIWSAQTLYAYLVTKEVPCDWIDARDILVVRSETAGLGEKGDVSTGGVVPLWGETSTRMAKWWNTVGKAGGFHDLDYSKVSPILVATGFVARTAEGVPTTLKRSGSDYSATILAKLTAAGRVTMWKNTDGVYTADPRRVPEAFPIESLKYDEAMELAYFGAQVLHPSAMVPCIDDNIPVYVRNIFNPEFKGTVIQGRSPSLKEVNANAIVRNWRAHSGEIPIKGITSVDKIALVTLEGASVIGGSRAAERFMGTMSNNGINVLIITQASSESSICVAVPENQGQRALDALQNAFELELARSTVNALSMIKGMSIVAIVGEGMALKSGVSATFMSSLARANVNIRLIAQGSSERQVAVVVDASQTSRALRAAHMAFTLSETAASVTVLGCTGQVGSALMDQLSRQRERLLEDLNVEMRVNVAASSKKLVLGKNSKCLDLARISDLLEGPDAQPLDLELVTETMKADVNPQRVIIDCTNCNEVSEYYERWVSMGINIISPNRKVAAGPLNSYDRVIQATRANQVNWLYESSVGSALPVLSTLRDLQETGDKVKVIRGSLSGVMAYTLNKMSEEIPFSVALEQAVNKKFSELDVREDISGLDVARKVVILARQLGHRVEISDVEVESLISDDLIKKKYTVASGSSLNDMILEDLADVDASMLEKFKAAAGNDRVLRYMFEINNETGKCRVSLEAVDRVNPLFRLRFNENLVAFETERYTSSPLIIKGAAAGPDLAAAGIFADLLRLTRAFSTLQV